MTYEKIVEKVQKSFAKASGWDIGGHKAIQINVRGEGEGAFYIEVSEGKFNVQPYEYYDNDAVVTISSKVLIDIMDGKTEPADAYSAQKYSIVGDADVANKILSLRTVSEAKKAVKKAADETKKAAKKVSAQTKKAASKTTKTAKKEVKKATAETKKAVKKATDETAKAAKAVAEEVKAETKKAVKKATDETKKAAKKATAETKKVAKKAADETKKVAEKVTAKAEEVKAAVPTVKPAFKRPLAIKPADDKK
ncbi:MAG: SCP2 sterol-binding domain-containing protein [Lachnospiraceae bacterium]|nr:SCP2 sterol-binding domain-containing protein [Lachnospiraceae bacterium]MBR6302737.1 SCP2 sterol-binding domain-containing protein [Lachnospiraceae bacterium]